MAWHLGTCDLLALLPVLCAFVKWWKEEASQGMNQSLFQSRNFLSQKVLELQFCPNAGDLMRSRMNLEKYLGCQWLVEV